MEMKKREIKNIHVQILNCLWSFTSLWMRFYDMAGKCQQQAALYGKHPGLLHLNCLCFDH